MGASFLPGTGSVALHTDLCSPVPTDPTWSRLPDTSRRVLLRDGRPLWHRLVEELEPDVLLVSVAKQHLASIEFEPAGDWFELLRIPHKSPYVVNIRRLRIGRKSTLLVTGRAAQTPFGSLSVTYKSAVGQAVKEQLP